VEKKVAIVQHVSKNAVSILVD